MTKKDANGMPYREAFAFGLNTCALCTNPATKGMRPITLKRPIFADYRKTEVLVPAGRQHFHSDCWARHREEELADESV